MTAKPWPHGRCEHSTSLGRMVCGKAGRWMVDGVIFCGEHKPAQTQRCRYLTWIPRKNGSPLGFVTEVGEILARDIRHAEAVAMFPGDCVCYDRDGMFRPDEDGMTLAKRLSSGRTS